MYGLTPFPLQSLGFLILNMWRMTCCTEQLSGMQEEVDKVVLQSLGSSVAQGKSGGGSCNYICFCLVLLLMSHLDLL